MQTSSVPRNFLARSLAGAPPVTTVPNPITDQAVQQIKLKVRDALERQKRSIEIVVFDFNPDGQPAGSDNFGSPSDLADYIRNKDALLLAGSNAEAAELSRRVHAKLTQMGSVGPPQAALSDGNHAGVGDLVRARLNTETDADGRKPAWTDLCLTPPPLHTHRIVRPPIRHPSSSYLPVRSADRSSISGLPESRSSCR